MLRPRIIPSLLIHKGGLVKTTLFANHKYIGDPLNAVRIFNEKEVDELFIADIDATTSGREPDYCMLAKLASECRMPLCYAGGIKKLDQIERIIALGIEKVGLSSSAFLNPNLISEASKSLGSQSIVVVLDVRKSNLASGYEIYTHNGSVGTKIDPIEFSKKAMGLGAGEILINAIDCDGMMGGYDHNLIGLLRKAVTLPITALGGAGSLEDMARLFKQFGVMGAAAGSIFLFKGKYKAVLIQYPNWADKDLIFS